MISNIKLPYVLKYTFENICSCPHFALQCLQHRKWQQGPQMQHLPQLEFPPASRVVKSLILYLDRNLPKGKRRAKLWLLLGFPMMVCYCKKSTLKDNWLYLWLSIDWTSNFNAASKCWHLYKKGLCLIDQVHCFASSVLESCDDWWHGLAHLRSVICSGIKYRSNGWRFLCSTYEYYYIDLQTVKLHHLCFSCDAPSHCKHELHMSQNCRDFIVHS